MRQAKIPASNIRPSSTIRKLNAPVKGWYTTDSIADAPKDTALIIDNWFCQPDAIRVRGGYASHATGLGGAVETLMVYTSGTATSFWGAANGDIFDITSAGAVGAAAVTALTNNRWQTLNFATAGGQFLLAVNGADTPLNYDGTTWNTTPAITGTGLTATDLVDVFTHQSRVWFLESGTTSGWYLAAASIGGAATEFNFGSKMTKGGYLVAGASWSVDAGAGMDDMFVVISSEGEILVYQGTDPASASTWALIGVYESGKPVGRRCFFKVGGDLLIITEDGLIPMSKIIKLDRAVMSTEAITKNIRTAYSDSVQQHGSKFGWQIETLPSENMAILNIPTNEASTAEQYVMNTQTGAWSRFTGMNAGCWAFYGGSIYFGDPNGEVFIAETGSVDGASVMQAFVVPAYSDLGSPAILKHVKMIRPILASNVDASPGVGVAFDYEDPSSPSSVGGVGVSGFTWDVSNWDEAVWAGTEVYNRWRSGTGIGSAVSPVLSVNVTGGSTGTDLLFRLLATHIVYETGGIMG